MEFLYFLEGLRNPVFDFIFSLITHLGEETLFLVIAIFIFWCVDKRGGYYVLMTGLIGTVINQWLKIVCRVPRPWVLGAEAGFKPVESAFAEAGGYSFPSGHTQNIAGTFGSIFAFFKAKWLRISAIVIILLVSFSRMYLGVHTPSDVVVSLAVAAALVLVLYPVFSSEERFNKYMPYVVGVSVVLTVAYVIFVNMLPAEEYVTDITISPDGTVHDPLGSALKNGATLIGCMLGLLVVYPVDRLVIKFETEANWYSQIIKLAGGLGGVLIIKSGLSTPLKLLVGLFMENPDNVARAIRYFLIVVFAGVVWPLTFKFFKGLRIGFMERFAEWVRLKLSVLNAKFKKNDQIDENV